MTHPNTADADAQPDVNAPGAHSHDVHASCADAFAVSRRALMAGGLATLVAACAKGAADSGVLYVGDQKDLLQSAMRASGNLDKLSYRIEWSSFPNAGPLLEALNAGAIDTGIGGDAPFIFSIGSNATIKAIGALKYEGAGPLLVVRDNSPIKSFADIAGKRVATPKGSIGHNLVLAALEAQGKPLDAVNFAFLSPQDGQSALRSGAVDAWAIWEPAATLAVRDGARIIPGTQDLVPSYALLFARDGAIKEKRPLLADYRQRFYGSSAWAVKHPDEYAVLLAKATGVPADIWRDVYGRTPRPPVPIDNTILADQQKTADRYFRAGLIAKRLDVKSGFDTSFS